MDILVVLLRAIFIVFFFGFCIFIHEFGHLIVALWQGLYVEKFSIGFGKSLFSFKWRGVEFSVGCLPFGGYVMLPQLDPTDEPKTSDGRLLTPSTPKARALTAFAGPLFNVLFGFVLATVMCCVGLWEPPVSSSLLVAGVPKVLPVAGKELKNEDKILAINGQAIAPFQGVVLDKWEDICYVWDEVTGKMEVSDEKPMTVTVLRNNEKQEIEITPEINPEWAGGLRDGDRIVTVNGRQFTKGESEFRNEYLFAEYAQVELEVVRNGEKLSLEYIPAPNPNMENLGYPFFDVYSPATIGTIEKESPAEKAGLEVGDQVLALNRENIPSVRWLETKLGENIAGCTLNVMRGRDEVVVEMPGVTDSGNDGLGQWGIGFSVLVSEVIDGMPGEKAGLQSEDQIVAVDGIKLLDVTQLTELIRGSNGKSLKLDCERDNKPFSVDITPVKKIVAGVEIYQVGIMLTDAKSRVLGHPSPWAQFENVFSMTTRTLGLLFAPVTRRVKSVVSGETEQAPRAGVKLQHMSGPIGIITMLWLRLKTEGLRGGMAFIILITFSLAFMNLLPLPVLDGGHILFSLIETLIRRRLPVKFVGVINNIFAVLLIALMLYITVFDSKRIYKLHQNSSVAEETQQTEVEEEAEVSSDLEK